MILPETHWGNPTNIAGYTVKEERFIPEVNALCILLEHIQSGARVMKIAADDCNKTFSIAFPTLPGSDSGAPHILEHSVLNGSLNFPVKSPFDVLSKGSLSTFLNAMTSDDFTIYPVASMNEKDYFNLMHVYLDAVFHPMIYSDKRIFMQEGWHYELAGVQNPLEYKGVVYNEMKGAFSNPERELWYRIQQLLFAGNHYRYLSGGHPEVIPDLDYEEFLEFHRKNYHPSNSFIYLYGDADLGKELEFIDRNYLSAYTRVDYGFHIDNIDPFNRIKGASGYYSVLEGAPMEHQTYLSYSWITGSGADPDLTMALNVMADLLVNQESAPLRKALQQAGIGKDVYAMSQNMMQNLFSIVVTNANAGDRDFFKKIVEDTLNTLVKEGIDRNVLAGTINRLEFRLREGNDAQKGITGIMRCINGWIYNGNPFAWLEYEKLLDKLKTSMQGSYLEDWFRSELLENSTALVYVLEPMEGLESKIAEKTMTKLASIKAKMNDAEIAACIEETSALIAFQQKEESTEALASIPFLKPEDIDRTAKWYGAEKYRVGGVPHLYFDEFTNGVLYMHFWFNCLVIPEEKIPYAALLTQLLGKLATADYTGDRLDTELNMNTGGFSSSLQVFLPQHREQELTPMFRIYMKTTAGKLDKAMELLESVISRSVFENRERLHELLKRHQSQVEMFVTQNGYSAAVCRLESYYSRRGQFVERTRGIEYYRFITSLLDQFTQNQDAVIGVLREVYALIFSKENLTVGVICDKQDYGRYKSSFVPFSERIVSRISVKQNWKLTPQTANEGICTSSKVQYVVQGFNYMNAGIKWNNKWHVLSQILSTDWLHTQVRVVGGAYGGYVHIHRNGSFYFGSYQDPNLKETLNVYKNTADYLEQFTADRDSMTRFIIGTVAGLDYPLTAAEKGALAFRWHFEKVSREDIQSERDDVLSTTMEDIRGMSGDLRQIINRQVYCVYGNEEKIRMHEAQFKKIMKLAE
jgi:presequence protease